ncbi:hypothetical protein C4573_04705 [Candidatus Woesearchaeota archaeon]|nr:MAG: hypothetical protein C4573_04705 [Candidatus Woesearchaeota archaeon]
MDEEFAPVFVKINDYKDILDIVDVIKKKVKDAQETLNRINDLKDEEDRELEDWSAHLDQITAKIEYINKSLFEPNV